jgi:hypothetical protein
MLVGEPLGSEALALVALIKPEEHPLRLHTSPIRIGTDPDGSRPGWRGRGRPESRADRLAVLIQEIAADPYQPVPRFVAVGESGGWRNSGIRGLNEASGGVTLWNPTSVPGVPGRDSCQERGSPVVPRKRRWATGSTDEAGEELPAVPVIDGCGADDGTHAAGSLADLDRGDEVAQDTSHAGGVRDCMYGRARAGGLRPPGRLKTGRRLPACPTRVGE